MHRLRVAAFIAGVFLASVFSSPVFANSLPILSIQPASSSVNAGSNVTLDVNIANVTDLFGFQFDLSFAPGTLSARSITEGSFLPSGGSTFFLPGTIDNVAGTIAFNADTLLGSVPGVNGSGTLAIFTLSGLAPGTSAIDLSNVVLLNSNFNSIDASIQNASLKVSPAAVVPEPATMLLFATGLVTLGLRRRRQIVRRA